MVFGGFFYSVSGQADSIYKKRYCTAVEITIPPEIDGWLTDEAWSAAEWAGDFMMHEPYDDRPATLSTQFKIIFDQDYMYVGMRAFDPYPDSIVSRLTRRDDMDGDMMAFQFDSYHDLRTAFTFFASVAGSKMDILMTNDGENEDETWDPIWWVETQTDDKGWTLEAKIPFSQLRFDKNSDGIWGFQAAREVFRNSELSLWQPISRESPGWVHFLGELNGLKGINPRKQADLTPYIVTGLETFEKNGGDPFRESGRDLNTNAGLDAKIGVTNNFTLDMTLNPDFGQVEADPSVVNLTAFETFYDEKRPFFIEGRSIFEYDLAIHNMDNLFYSRRIGRNPHHYPELTENEYADVPAFTNIIGAAKLSGKTGNGLSVGILESITSREKAEIDLNGERRFETVEPLTNYFAGRVIREINNGNTILGGMATTVNRFTDEEHLEYLHSGAYSGGLDFQQYFLNRNYSLKLSTCFSHVRGSEESILRTQLSPGKYYQRPDADYVTLDSSRNSLSGYGGTMQFSRISGHFNFLGFLNFKSPGLELNDIGYASEYGEIIEILWMGYNFTEPFSVFRSMSLNIGQWTGYDFGGHFEYYGGNFEGHADFKNFWETGLGVNFESDVRSNFVLRGGPSMLWPGNLNFWSYAGSNSRNKFTTELSYSYNRGLNNSGKGHSAELELEYKPFSNLDFSIEPGFNHAYSELQYVMQYHSGENDRYIFGSIERKTLALSLRINLILTPELTLQYWGQPFIATGRYSDFKIITEPLAEDFTDRFRLYGPGEITLNDSGDTYLINEPESGLSYTFSVPDFNVREFLSNMVFRWEYRPGSYLYLVWSQTREGYENYGILDFQDDFRNIWDIHPHNIFLVKFSYRIGR